ncbi:hypothetical protein SETIT_9G354500v2 [Setaria italica]|uniref:Uncharacterized protein n=1 Tax=Setaria italica TaxID=4555 RepID=A0A368SPB0_SETIT|nr:hypothetical protein SETIT_9G354500v2 [Setaria italica]
MHRDIWHVSRRCCSRRSYQMSIHKRDSIHEIGFSRSYFAPLFYQDQNER